jgi:hypothetical protein
LRFENFIHEAPRVSKMGELYAQANRTRKMPQAHFRNQVVDFDTKSRIETGKI